MSTEEEDVAEAGGAPRSELWTVDRFERHMAVLVGPAGASMEVDRERLPSAARVGVVMRVPCDGDGKVRWSGVVVDEEATAERRSEAEEILGELKGRDPGGDLAL